MSQAGHVFDQAFVRFALLFDDMGYVLLKEPLNVRRMSEGTNE